MGGWMPNDTGAFLDDTLTPTAASPRSTASPDGRIQDWPIQGQREKGVMGPAHPARDVGRSDYVPPKGW